MNRIYNEIGIGDCKGLRVVAPQSNKKVSELQIVTIFGEVSLYDVTFGNTKLTVKCQNRDDGQIFISDIHEYEYIENQGYSFKSNRREMISIPGEDIITCLESYYKGHSDLEISTSLEELIDFDDILLKHH